MQTNLLPCQYTIFSGKLQRKKKKKMKEKQSKEIINKTLIARKQTKLTKEKKGEKQRET